MSGQKRSRESKDDHSSVGSTSSRLNGNQSSDSTSSSPASNLVGVTPKIGMRLEIRDSDYIWSSAHLVSVEKDSRAGTDKTLVTVRCDGWGDVWDEKVSWPSDRLARLYTYTRRVRCFVSILPKNRGQKKKALPKEFLLGKAKKPIKRVFSNLWPCTVQFRMPHPFIDGRSDEEQCLRAEELLRLEVNVFVQPYAVSLLPKHIASSLDDDGGRWVNNGRLRLWRDDPTELGVLPTNFEHAFEEAKTDSSVPGTLPQKALVDGSLLDDIYRVRSLNPVSSCGVLVPAAGVKRSAPQPKPPKIVRVSSVNVDERKEDPMSSKDKPSYEPPPDFPPCVRITEPIYPGVTRCGKSNQWIASVSMGGNDVFLGSFPTQTQAWNATMMNSKVDDNRQALDPTDLEAAQLADLRSLPMEAIMDATRKQWHPSNNFVLHDWTIQQIRHRAYLKECEEGSKEFESGQDKSDDKTGARADATPTTGSSLGVAKNKRKPSRPRKVDIARHRYAL